MPLEQGEIDCTSNMQELTKNLLRKFLASDHPFALENHSRYIGAFLENGPW